MSTLRDGTRKGSATVTPSDSSNLPVAPCQGLWVGTTGNVSLVLHTDDGTSPRLFKNVPSGTFLDFAIKKILATNTTATDLVALY